MNDNEEMLDLSPEQILAQAQNKLGLLSALDRSEGWGVLVNDGEEKIAELLNKVLKPKKTIEDLIEMVSVLGEIRGIKAFAEMVPLGIEMAEWEIETNKPPEEDNED